MLFSNSYLVQSRKCLLKGFGRHFEYYQNTLELQLNICASSGMLASRKN